MLKVSKSNKTLWIRSCHPPSLTMSHAALLSEKLLFPQTLGGQSEDTLPMSLIAF